MQQLPMTIGSTDPQASEYNRLAEISFPLGADSGRHILAGILRELDQREDQRWVCWVATSPIKALITPSTRPGGQHILQVVCRQARELLSLAERALTAGRSHTVAVLVDHELDDASRAALQRAARAGQADCLIVRRV